MFRRCEPIYLDLNGNFDWKENLNFVFFGLLKMHLCSSFCFSLVSYSPNIFITHVIFHTNKKCILKNTKCQTCAAYFAYYTRNRCTYSVCLSTVIWYSVSDRSIQCISFLLCMRARIPVEQVIWFDLCACIRVFVLVCNGFVCVSVRVLSHLFSSWKQVFYERRDYIHFARRCCLLCF